MKKKRRTNLSTKTKNIKPQKIIKKEEPKVICENKAFFFNNGPNITNMSGLISHLKICENQDFKHHVNEYKNDLSNWIHHCLEEKELAESVSSLTQKNETIELLEKFMEKNLF